MACWKARGSARRGVMSLKRIPGLGKSGMSRMYAFRSIGRASLTPAPPRGGEGGGQSAGYGFPFGETTVPLTVRPGGADDGPLIADMNARMARETEGKALDPATLAAGVRAVLADPARGRYFI